MLLMQLTAPQGSLPPVTPLSTAPPAVQRAAHAAPPPAEYYRQRHLLQEAVQAPLPLNLPFNFSSPPARLIHIHSVRGQPEDPSAFGRTGTAAAARPTDGGLNSSPSSSVAHTSSRMRHLRALPLAVAVLLATAAGAGAQPRVMPGRRPKDCGEVGQKCCPECPPGTELSGERRWDVVGGCVSSPTEVETVHARSWFISSNTSPPPGATVHDPSI
jgi:hypothetical protein